jgi:hypothetical protein
MPIAKEDLEKVYEWRQAHAKGLGDGCFRLSGLILTPLLAAVFDSSAEIETWALLAYLGGALLAARAGVRWHRETRRLQLEYATQVEVPTLEDMPPGVVTW